MKKLWVIVLFSAVFFISGFFIGVSVGQSAAHGSMSNSAPVIQSTPFCINGQCCYLAQDGGQLNTHCIPYNQTPTEGP